jgi:hypothetical protein
MIPPLSQDPLTSEAIGGALARRVLLGVPQKDATDLIARAAALIPARLDAIAAGSAAPGEREALIAARDGERARLQELAVASAPALHQSLLALRGDQKTLRDSLGPTLASALPADRDGLLRAERSLAGVLGDARAKSEPSRALDAVSTYHDKLSAIAGSAPSDIAAGMLDRVGQLRDALQAHAAPTSPVLQDHEAKLAGLPEPAPEHGRVAADVQAAAPAPSEVMAQLGMPGAPMLGALAGRAVAGKAADDVANAVRARAEEFARHIGSVAAKLTGTQGHGPVAPAPEFAPEDFGKLRDAVARAAGNPDRFAKEIGAQLDGLHVTGDPDLANQAANKINAIASHLASILPRSMDGGAQLGRDPEATLSSSERSTFMKRAAAAFYPEVVLHELSTGMLTPDTMQTADAVHGTTMGVLRERLIEAIGQKKIDPRFRVPIAILMGPEVAGLSPSSIAKSQERMQAELARAARPANLAQSGSTASQTRTAEDTRGAATPAQRYQGA